MLFRIALLACLMPLSAMAEVHEVRMLNRNDTGAMPFEPDYLVIQPGDTVKFLAANPGHNAATIDGMIPEGARNSSARSTRKSRSRWMPRASGASNARLITRWAWQC